MSKILITGVGGLLGSRLADWIINNTDNQVVGIDDFSGGYIENVNNSSLITTSISGKTLTLSFQNNQNGTAELVIRGTSNGKTADDTFEIVVNAADDAPTVANAPSDVTVNEDADNTVIDLSNVINDIDNENTSIQLSLVDKGNESIVAVDLSDNILTKLTLTPLLINSVLFLIFLPSFTTLKSSRLSTILT